MDVYRYNPKAHYATGNCQATLCNLDKLDVYVNNAQYVRIELKDIFTAYDLHSESKRILPPSGEARATSALGISMEHLKAFDLLLLALYRFHTYYNTRRILKIMDVALPNEVGFNKT